jgi:hypothetical protein
VWLLPDGDSLVAETCGTDNILQKVRVMVYSDHILQVYYGCVISNLFPVVPKPDCYKK